MPPVATVQEFMDQYSAYYPKIYNFFFRDCLHRETAEDLTATTFTKALQYLKSGGRPILNFNAWIYRIATNELYTHLNKKQRRRARIVEDTDGSLVDSIGDARQNRDDFADFWAVRKALERLGREERVLIEMHFFDKMDYAEMAEALSIKSVTLRSKIHRTLKKLQGIMKEVDR